MRIIHLLQSPRFSGAENVVCQIINLMRNESNIEMIYCSRDGQIREALEERKIQFVPIEDITVREVRRVISEYKPDIVHAHDMRASYIAIRACANIPVISHIHNNNFNSRGVSPKAIAYLFAGLRAKHIFWVSDSSYYGYAFHRLLKKKSEVLYNIIDIKLLYEKMRLDKNEYEFDIVYLGRLTEQKNPMRLMKVFKKITIQNPNVKIAVVGTGELEAQTRNEAEKLGLMDNVRFLGFQSNPYKILHDSKLMILTSLWEGTPMCVLEALSLGVPVISTPTDGVNVVINHGKDGYLTDNDEAMTRYALDLISNERLREKMSKNALEKADRINDPTKYKERLFEAYFHA